MSIARWLLSLVLFTAVSVRAAHGQSARVYKNRVVANWFSEGKMFWYRNELPEKKSEFVLVDVEQGLRRAAFDHDRIAEALSTAVAADISGDRLPIRSLSFSKSLDRVTVTGQLGTWTIDLGSYKIVSGSDVEPDSDESNVRLFLPARPSVNKGGRADLRVVNRRDAAVELLWVNHSGQRISYGKVDSEKSHSLGTFLGHAWLLVDEFGTDVAAFVADRDPTVVVVDEKTDVRPQVQEQPRQTDRNANQRIGNRGVSSPDNRFRVFVHEHNLQLSRSHDDENRTALTSYGTPQNTFRRDAQRARLLQMQYSKADYPDDQPDVSWSPTSRHFIAFQTTQVNERRVRYVESSPKDSLYPVVHEYPYAKPGDEIPVRSIHLFEVDTRREIPVSSQLFSNPFDLKLLKWSDDGSRCWLEYNERGHQTLRILEVSTADGSVRSIVDERSETFIHYSTAGKHVVEWLPEEQLLWASERSGWNHLYRYDVANAKLINAVTAGDWNVRRIDRVDREKQQIWFYAVGIRPEQDPYHEHYCRVNFDGSGLVVLTEGDGTHDVTFSPDRRYFVDRFSRVDLPPVTELRRADSGRLVVELEEADGSEVLESRGSFPIRFTTPGRDGKTAIYGIIHRPNDFDETKKYPVVENIYAGPHDHHVPKTFRSRYRHQHQIADRGFVVVQIDGMGTAWRSKEFHDVCYRNLRDAGFADRIAWIKSAAEKYPWIDVTRVGLYGGSAGGQNAMAALLWHGDFYSAAVADCGCHDNRMDKLWWNEQWMGVPGDGHYVRNSNMENADRLQGHLMLVVGELDRNVDPASTTQVVKKLIDADKEFDFLLIPGTGHGACETAYGSRRRADFFVRWLQSD